MRPDLRSIEHLAALAPAGRPMTRSTLARSMIGPSTGPLHRRLGHRVPRPAQRREALDELGDPLDGAAAQVGLVGRAEGGDPLADAAVLVGEAGHGLVDEVDRRRLAAPVEQQLDRLVRHLAAGDGRRPGERLGRRGGGSRTAARRPTLNLVTDRWLSSRRAAELGQAVDARRAGGRRRRPGRRRPAPRCGAAPSSVRSWTGVSARPGRTWRRSSSATVPRGCQAGPGTRPAHPLFILRAMESSSTVRFAHAARTLAREARRRGLGRPELPLPAPAGRRRSHAAAPAGRRRRVGARCAAGRGRPCSPT